MHAVMGIVYRSVSGLFDSADDRVVELATGFGASYHGFPAWILLMLASGVGASGIRDLIASDRPAAA